ncbi:MAG: winged helix-turn-helix transcriptional regulator [Bdellovibrionales bacterium]|nr:winged helix-turn-helix transcriptional regulator [Bdellovibrionales bacterium]
MSNVKSLPDKEQCESVAHTLKILAHPQRLMILCQLTDGPKTVGELEELCGASQSAVSQFLQRMKSEGLVNCERNSQYIYYNIADKDIQKVIQSLYKIYCGA